MAKKSLKERLAKKASNDDLSAEDRQRELKEIAKVYERHFGAEAKVINPLWKEDEDRKRRIDRMQECSITNSTASESHVNELFFDARLISLVTIIQHKGFTGAVRRLATVTLFTLGTFAGTGNMIATTGGAANGNMTIHSTEFTGNLQV